MLAYVTRSAKVDLGFRAETFLVLHNASAGRRLSSQATPTRTITFPDLSVGAL